MVVGVKSGEYCHFGVCEVETKKAAHALALAGIVLCIISAHVWFVLPDNVPASDRIFDAVINFVFAVAYASVLLALREENRRLLWPYLIVGAAILVYEMVFFFLLFINIIIASEYKRPVDDNNISNIYKSINVTEQAGAIAAAQKMLEIGVEKAQFKCLVYSTILTGFHYLLNVCFYWTIRRAHNFMKDEELERQPSTSTILSPPYQENPANILSSALAINP